MDEKKERKPRICWLLVGTIATATFSDGIEVNYDLTTLLEGLVGNQKAMAFYGFKQWVASNWASEKTPADQRSSAQSDYDDMINIGLELADGEKQTQVKIIGKESKKGGGKLLGDIKAAAMLSLEHLKAAKLLLPVDKFTAEMQAALDYMLKVEAEEQAKLDAKAKPKK